MPGDIKGDVAVREADSRLHVLREKDSRELDRKEEVILEVGSREECFQEVGSREECIQEAVCREVEKGPEMPPDLLSGASFRTGVIEGKLANISTMTRVFFRDPRGKHISRKK